MQVLITGASGFVGSAVVRHLARDPDLFPIAAVRRQSETRDTAERIVGNIGPATNWREALAGVEAVVHCAALAHQPQDFSSGSAATFQEVNAAGTRRLAEEAAERGVTRFVFISSIKVNGESTPPNQAFTETDVPAPQDAYGRSKLEAERALTDIGTRAGMEVVTLRPPLVYGPNPKGNLHRLMRWIARGIPLPLASIRNRRSLIGRDNLASAIALALTHPAASGKTYLVSDQDDLSTPDLISILAKGMGCGTQLFPMPVAFLRAAGAITGLESEVRRLADSLVVDSDLITKDLGWRPLRRPWEGLEQMARAFYR